MSNTTDATVDNGWASGMIKQGRIGLIRQSTATHGLCGDQRYVGLTVLRTTSDSITVEAPPHGNIAPPGYYMLFLLAEHTGTPSMGSIVHLS